LFKLVFTDETGVEVRSSFFYENNKLIIVYSKQTLTIPRIEPVLAVFLNKLI